MMKSMTGYGRAIQMVDGREITVELRAVNNRYLDCMIKLPRQLNFAEDAIRQAVRSAVSRGKIELYVSLASPSGEAVTISLNRAAVEGYLNVLHAIAAEYDVKDDITVSSLTRFSDIFLAEREKADEEQEKAALMEVVTAAIAEFNAMREQEGQALEADLRSRAATILTLVEKIEQRSPVTQREYRARLESKMREVLENQAIDESRLLTEVAIFADKIAVDEETVRLRSHLNQFEQMLRSNEPIGRKLDFLLQEMNREANTIGSKCNDVEQARTVVDIKAELEKIREQIQNIE